MHNFCGDNKSDIQQKFKCKISSEDAAFILMEEAVELKDVNLSELQLSKRKESLSSLI